MPSGLPAKELPSKELLQNRSADEREVFLEIRSWVKARQHDLVALAAEAKRLDSEHRKCLFDFLTTLPERKPIFHSNAREILSILSSQPEWRSGGAVDDAVLAAALAAPRRGSAGSRAGSVPADRRRGSKDVPSSHDQAASVGPAASTAPPTDSPSPAAASLPSDPDPEPEPDDDPPAVKPLEGFPPSDAFLEGSKHDAGDTFKDLRKWARKLAVWDLAEAGRLISANVRRDVFRFLTRICARKIYSRVGKETLSMLLSVQDWVQGDGVIDAELEGDLDRTMAQRPSPRPDGPPADREPGAVLTPLPPQPAAPKPGDGGGPAAPQGGAPRPGVGAQRLSVPTPAAPPNPLPPAPALVGPRDRPGPRAAAVPAGLRARVEAALRSGGTAISDGEELVRLYQESGLGGEASLKGKARDAELLRLLLVVATQRMRDFYIDDLRRAPGGRTVHFPHLHIDLQRRNTSTMPDSMRSIIEGKIRRLERWTAEEKAHVLSTKHEFTLRYVLAYSLARAKASNRSGAIWIPLGMSTGSTGHANAVCLLAGKDGEPAKALVYDPNFAPNQEHWVHAQKAINDALPKVRKLLDGTGVVVPDRAELFGNGLQTSLGTVAQQKAWFSSTVYTTRRGYPICGSVVHLVATMWVSTGARSPVEVEAALSEIVSSGPDGKALVQRRIAGMLKGFDSRLSDNGEEPFAKGLTRRVDADRAQWSKEAFTGNGSFTVSDGKGRSCTYSW